MRSYRSLDLDLVAARQDQLPTILEGSDDHAQVVVTGGGNGEVSNAAPQPANLDRVTDVEAASESVRHDVLRVCVVGVARANHVG